MRRSKQKRIREKSVFDYQFEEMGGSKWRRKNRSFESNPYGKAGALKFKTTASGKKQCNSTSMLAYESREQRQMNSALKRALRQG